MWFILVSSWVWSHFFFFFPFFQRGTLIGQFVWNIGHSHIETPLWTQSQNKNKNSTLLAYLFSWCTWELNWGKPYDIELRCYWEHLGELKGTWWEHIENKEEKKKLPSPPLPGFRVCFPQILKNFLYHPPYTYNPSPPWTKIFIHSLSRWCMPGKKRRARGYASWNITGKIGKTTSKGPCSWRTWGHHDSFSLWQNHLLQLYKTICLLCVCLYCVENGYRV